MKGGRVLYGIVCLVAAVVLSQSVGKVSVQSGKNISFASSCLFVSAQKGTKSLSETGGKKATDFLAALSETRVYSSNNQEDFFLCGDCGLASRSEKSLNSRLQSIRTNLVLKKKLVQLRVLRI